MSDIDQSTILTFMISHGQHRRGSQVPCNSNHLISQQKHSAWALSMQIPGVANVKGRFDIGIPSVPNACRKSNCSSTGKNVLAAAVTPVSAQSEGHSFRLLLEVCMASVLVMILSIIPLLLRCCLSLTAYLCYDVQRAREYTYRHPEGQLHGRQGRRSVLEDGISTPYVLFTLVLTLQACV